MVYLVEQVSAFLVPQRHVSTFDLIAKLSMVGRYKTKPCISWTALVVCCITDPKDQDTAP